MPQGLAPWELEPVASRRKRFVANGVYPRDHVQLNGWKNPREKQRHWCCRCKKEFEWMAELEFTDFGQVVDDLCKECRVELRKLMTNHPEIKE